MAKAKKKTARGRKQDPPRVAGGQEYEVRYEAKKTGRSATMVRKAVKKVGNSRKRVEKRLGDECARSSQRYSRAVNEGRHCTCRRILRGSPTR
jgi:hypothetical protein